MPDEYWQYRCGAIVRWSIDPGTTYHVVARRYTEGITSPYAQYGLWAADDPDIPTRDSDITLRGLWANEKDVQPWEEVPHA